MEGLWWVGRRLGTRILGPSEAFVAMLASSRPCLSIGGLRMGDSAVTHSFSEVFLTD